MSNRRFGIKEVADVTFYELDEHGSPTKAVICLDTLKMSNIELSAEQSDAKGGKGNTPLLIWDHSKEINLILQDAVLSDRMLEIMFGKNSDGVATISANTFPGCYYIEGITYARDMKTGRDDVFKFIIPKAKIVSENTITMEADGDPTVFDLKVRVLRNSDGIMMKMSINPYGLKFTQIKGGYMISGLEAFTSSQIIIPETYNNEPVKSIDSYAFMGDPVVSVLIPGSVEEIRIGAFKNCKNLSSISIQEGVTLIDSFAFTECNSLKSVHIPSTIKTLYSNTFVQCPSLTAFSVGENNKKYSAIDGILFSKEGTTLIAFPEGKSKHCTVPESTLKLGEGAFAFNQSLVSVTIPDSCNSIHRFTFEGCASFTTFIIGEDNQKYSAVDGVLFNKEKTTLRVYPAGRMGTYSIPNNVTAIATYAFNYCKGLTAVTIPEGVTAIPEGTFHMSEKLKSVVLHENITEIGASAFDGCESLTSISLPKNLTILDAGAFLQSGLTSIDIPGSVEELGEGLFYACHNLTSVNIGEGVEIIGEYVFEECTSLPSIIIPKSVVEIASDAFNGCDLLTTITINKEEDSIPGAPWGAENATIYWTGGES